jgi:hypothetical protein
MRVVVFTVAAAMLVLLSGCLGSQEPVNLAANEQIEPGVMPSADESGTAHPDPRQISAVRDGGSIMVDTPADQAVLRAQKKALMSSLDKLRAPGAASADPVAPRKTAKRTIGADPLATDNGSNTLR